MGGKMKQCKECKRDVSNANWSYKNSLCKRCDARNRQRNRHRENNPELKKLLGLTKEELFTKIVILKRIIGHQKTTITQKIAQIRHFRLRLLRMRNSINYLLEHPYGMDNSYRARSDERDFHGMPRLSQIYYSKRRYKEGKR